MKRFASARSEKRARQPGAGRAQCRVGSIDGEGIRYGFTTHALMASTSPTAAAIVTIQSRATRQGRGSLAKVRRNIGCLAWQREGSHGVRVQPGDELGFVLAA
jgi:hypothetical protein